MINIIEKTLSDCISITDIGIKYVKVINDKIFEEIDEIFDINSDSLKLLSDKYGPMFLLEDKYGRHFYNDGTWYFNFGPKIEMLNINSSNLYNRNGLKELNKNSILKNGSILKLTPFDFKNKSFVFRKIRGNKFHVVLVPNNLKDKFDSDTNKIRSNILITNPKVIITYY